MVGAPVLDFLLRLFCTGGGGGIAPDADAFLPAWSLRRDDLLVAAMMGLTLGPLPWFTTLCCEVLKVTVDRVLIALLNKGVRGKCMRFLVNNWKFQCDVHVSILVQAEG